MAATDQTTRIGSHNVRIVRKLGEGGFAFIYQVEDIDTGAVLCLKKMHIQSNDSRALAQKEMNLMQSFNHPNLVRTYDVQSSGKEALILMELCPGGHLLARMKRLQQEGRKLGEDEVIRIMGDVLKGVSNLHDRGIAHRDLKLENILISADRSYKLCDFGSAVVGPVSLATSADRGREEEVIEKTTTQMFRAPEMADIFMARELTTKVDMWALGCILYTLIYQRHPFQGEGNLAIINARITFPPTPAISEDMKDTILRMLTIDPDARADVAEIEACMAAMSSKKPLPARKALPTQERKKVDAAPPPAAAVISAPVVPQSLNPNSVAARRLAARQGSTNTGLSCVGPGLSPPPPSAARAEAGASTLGATASQQQPVPPIPVSISVGSTSQAPASQLLPLNSWQDMSPSPSITSAASTPGGQISSGAHTPIPLSNTWGTFGNSAQQNQQQQVPQHCFPSSVASEFSQFSNVAPPVMLSPQPNMGQQQNQQFWGTQVQGGNSISPIQPQYMQGVSDMMSNMTPQQQQQYMLLQQHQQYSQQMFLQQSMQMQAMGQSMQNLSMQQPPMATGGWNMGASMNNIVGSNMNSSSYNKIDPLHQQRSGTSTPSTETTSASPKFSQQRPVSLPIRGGAVGLPGALGIDKSSWNDGRLR